MRVECYLEFLDGDRNCLKLLRVSEITSGLCDLQNENENENERHARSRT